VLEDIYLMYYVHRVCDLRETRIYIIDTVLENKITIIQQLTTHTYYIVIFVPVN